MTAAERAIAAMRPSRWRASVGHHAEADAIVSAVEAVLGGVFAALLVQVALVMSFREEPIDAAWKRSRGMARWRFHYRRALT